MHVVYCSRAAKRSVPVDTIKIFTDDITISLFEVPSNNLLLSRFTSVEEKIPHGRSTREGLPA